MHIQHTGPSKRLRVIIVEDAPEQAMLLRFGLSHAGFEVDIVANGLEAIDQIEVKYYDVALVDYHMPGVDGFVVAKLLFNSIGRIARPVMIALTATPDQLIDRLQHDTNIFDTVLDKSCGLPVIVEAIRLLYAGGPASESRFAAKEFFWQQQEAIYFWVCNQRRTYEHGIINPMILIVEDDESQRQLLSSAMEGRGYGVDTANNGIDALQKIVENGFDIALIDYHLPDVDGCDLATLVHNRMARWARPRLVAFTSSPDKLEQQKALKGPLFDNIVGKSSGLGTLVTAVEQLLRTAPNPASRWSVALTSSIATGPI